MEKGKRVLDGLVVNKNEKVPDVLKPDCDELHNKCKSGETSSVESVKVQFYLSSMQSTGTRDTTELSTSEKSSLSIQEDNLVNVE